MKIKMKQNKENKNKNISNNNNINNSKSKIKKILIKNLKQLFNLIPILISIILLISLINNLIPNDFYNNIFTRYEFLNMLIIDIIGSILVGTPIAAYIISEEFLKNNLSLFIVTTFILAWTTVGIVQFPAEAILMGKKFAIVRNSLAFIFAIISSYLTVIIYGVLI